MNGDKKLAVFGIAAACVIGLINHMQYRNLAKRMEDLEVTVEMELFPDLAFPRIHTRKVRKEEEPDWWEEDLASSCEAGSTEGSSPLSRVSCKAAFSQRDCFQYGGRMTDAGGNE